MGINGAVGYVYDAVGNRKQMTSTLAARPTGLWNYDANDRLTTDTYDADGNTPLHTPIRRSERSAQEVVLHHMISYDTEETSAA